VPPTADDYTRRGLPWFTYYDDSATSLDGADNLAGMKSVTELGKEKGGQPLPENTSVDPTNIHEIRKDLEPGQVREGEF
jgi:hypothetical protein